MRSHLGTSWLMLALPALVACGPTSPPGGGWYQVMDGQSTVDSSSGSDVTTDAVQDEVAQASDAAGEPDLPGSPDVPVDSGPAPASPLVDPQCVDGQYTEPLPVQADIAPILAQFQAGAHHALVLDVLGARYPIGRHLVEGGLQSKKFGGKNCIDAFLAPQETGSANAVLQKLSTLVHECGHFYDIELGGFGKSTYVVRPDLVRTCSGASYSGTNKSFARSLLKGDEFAAKHPPCNKLGEQGCDGYAAIYLDGDPNDSKFQGGDQGYDSVLEETLQYVNSLATDYAFQDRIQGAVTARAGILTFLWYLQRYLRMARLEHPKVYAHLSGDPCWRETTLTVWGRAWLYLEATAGHPKLSYKAGELLELATDPVLVEEIERLRTAHGCP